MNIINSRQLFIARYLHSRFWVYSFLIFMSFSFFDLLFLATQFGMQGHGHGFLYHFNSISRLSFLVLFLHLIALSSFLWSCTVYCFLAFCCHLNRPTIVHGLFRLVYNCLFLFDSLILRNWRYFGFHVFGAYCAVLPFGLFIWFWLSFVWRCSVTQHVFSEFFGNKLAFLQAAV